MFFTFLMPYRKITRNAKKDGGSHKDSHHLAATGGWGEVYCGTCLTPYLTTLSDHLLNLLNNLRIGQCHNITDISLVRDSTKYPSHNLT